MPEVVNLRWMHETHVESAHPVYLLEETPDSIVTWEPGETTLMHSTRPLGGPRGRNLVPGSPHTGFHEATWSGDGVLRVHRPGQEWSTWRWLSADRRWSDQWYVNLEDPWVRTSTGFDTEDWILDIVAIDGAWQYKDEDELEWAESAGRFSSDRIVGIRAAASEAIDALEASRWPFDADWDRWLPDTALLPPALREGWDAPR